MAAITSYATLLTEAASTLNRSDLTSHIPGWVGMAEAAMNRRLRARKMITRSVATISDGYSAVPDDFLGVRTLSLTGTPKKLSFLTPDQFDQALQGQETGVPRYYTILGGEFGYYPTPSDDNTAQLSYWQKIPALSDANTSNWMLANHPDAYLYGSLIHSAPKLKDDERVTLWASAFGTILDDIERADRSESLGSVLTPIPGGGFAP
jgi:hypothetical protein